MTKMTLNGGVKCWCTLFNAFLSMILFNTTLFITATNATHFRGGTVWWSPSVDFSDASPQIHVEYQIGWRTTFKNDIICSEELIKNQTVNPGIGFWESEDGNIVPATFICTGFDPEQDWMTGYQSFHYTVTASNITIWNEGRCWVSGLYYSGCFWSLSFRVMPGIRSDTKKPNSSPLANTVPILNMHVACPTTVKLSTTDPDGDRVTCRFAQTELECGEACQKFPYFQLSEDCDLSYNGGGADAVVTVTIIIEDWADEDITLNHRGDIISLSQNQPISYIPLQFLVSLTTSTNPCNAKPWFVNPTPPQGQIVTTITGAPFLLSVYAEASSIEKNITDIIFLLPIGASRSELRSLPSNVYGVDVTWTPSFDQLDSKLICFTAKDSEGLLSELRCITVEVGGVSSPCSVNNGGCSDRCVRISGVSYACDCPRHCWYLDSDGRTCRPKVAVQCLPQTMEISVEKCAVDDDLVILAGYATSLSSIPEECQVSDIVDYYNFTVDFDSCKTVAQETFWELKYTNILRLYADTSSGDETSDAESTITRGAWYHVPVSCTFSKFGNLTLSFTPKERQVQLLDVPGLGSFTLFLEFYTNATYDQAIGPYDYPLSFTVNSDIHFGIRAVGGAGNMKVFTVECLAFPNNDASAIGYPMLSNGCIRDSTMVQHNTTSPMENHFSIKAFSFRNSFGNTEEPTVVNIQCLAMVCQNDNQAESRCNDGCIDDSNRRKRDLYSNIRKKRQALTITDDDDDDDENIPQSNITESPIQRVASSGNIQILVDVSTLPKPGNERDFHATMDEDAISTVIFVGIGIGVLLVIVIIGAAVFVLCHQKIIRTRNMILPEKDHQHDYIKKILVSDVSSCNEEKKGDLSPYFHLDPTRNEYVWARRVMPDPSSSLVAISQNSLDWSRLEKKSSL